MTDQLDWAKLGLNIGPRTEGAPRYDLEGRKLEGLVVVKGLRKTGSLPLDVLQAIAVATQAAVAEQKPARMEMTSTHKSKVARTLEVKVEETKPVAVEASVTVATPTVAGVWSTDNQLLHDTYTPRPHIQQQSQQQQPRKQLIPRQPIPKQLRKARTWIWRPWER